MPITITIPGVEDINDTTVMQFYKGNNGFPVIVSTNFVQTVGTETDGAGGDLYGGYTWRDAPKGNLSNESIARFAVTSGYGTSEGKLSIQTKVTEAANNHKYFLNQSLTIKLFGGPNPPGYVNVTHTFNSNDWDTTPVYNVETGIGYVANPYGPSSFYNVYLDVIEDAYLVHSRTGSTTIASPHSPFQPPGD